MNREMKIYRVISYDEIEVLRDATSILSRAVKVAFLPHDLGAKDYFDAQIDRINRILDKVVYGGVQK